MRSKSSTRPRRWRSSAMCPTPARRAWRGSAPVMAWPQTRTWPDAMCRRPVTASTSSLCPLPSMPARATISPARTCSVTPSTAGRSRSSSTCRSETSSATSPGLRLLLLDAQDDVAPDHHAREHRLVGAGGVDRPDALAAAQHRDAVGDLQHLGQLVGDEDDGRAARLQLREDAHELARLLRGQHRRRLVEHEHPRAAVQRAEDLDALLLPDGDVLDAGVRVDLQPVALGELLGRAAARP